MTNRNTILILGASSFIGRSLYARFGPKCIATHYKTPIQGGIYFDSLSMDLPEIIKNPEFISHAIILLGDTKLDSCVSNIKLSQALNVDSIKSILEYLKKWHIKPVFTSTEAVFDGTKGDYDESDKVNPIVTYAKQKVQVENFIQESFPKDHLILRLALVVSSQPHDGTLLSSWLDAIEQKKQSKCAYDYINTPIHVKDVAEAIYRLIENDSSGIFHISSYKPISRLKLYQMLLTQIKDQGLPGIEPIPCSIRDFDLLEKRPLNISMIPNKLVKATGLKITTMHQVCQTLLKRSFG